MPAKGETLTMNPVSIASKPIRGLAKSFTQKSEADKMFILGGLIYVPSAILSPIVTHLDLKQKQIAEKDRQLLVFQEIARQIVGASIWFLSYYGGDQVLQKLTKNSLKQAKLSPVARFIGSTVFATVGSGLIKPLLTNKLLVDKFYKKQTETKSKPSSSAHQRKSNPPPKIKETAYTSLKTNLHQSPVPKQFLYPAPPPFYGSQYSQWQSPRRSWPPQPRWNTEIPARNSAFGGFRTDLRRSTQS